MHTRANLQNRSVRSRQTGMISTIIAIIALVVSLLAAVALMRSVDISNSIAGTLTFRQGAIQEADRAYVTARTAFTYTEPTSDNNQANGYYASPQTPDSIHPDIPKVLTTNAAGTVGTVTALNTQNQVTYVVERLCPAAGPANPATCVVPGASIEGGSVSNQTKDNGPPFNSGAYPAFRLTVRVKGLKGDVSYVQTILH